MWNIILLRTQLIIDIFTKSKYLPFHAEQDNELIANFYVRESILLLSWYAILILFCINLFRHVVDELAESAPNINETLTTQGPSSRQPTTYWNYFIFNLNWFKFSFLSILF